jgi:hypothetical protein
VSHSNPNADKLVELARIFSGLVQEPLSKRFPRLFEGPQASEWAFFCTVACTWLACVTLHHSVPAEQRTPSELVVQRSLADWHPAAIAAYEDLHGFVVPMLAQESERAQRREVMELGVGTWIVWNIMLKREVENEFEIVAAIAGLISREFEGYWQQKL